jgi:hypothetical protein
MVETKPGKDSA